MKCEEIIKLLNYQIDSSKNSQYTDLIEKHINSCPSCLKEKGNLLKYKELFKTTFLDAKIPELSPSFDARFFEKAQKLEKVSILTNLKQKLAAILDIPLNRTLVPAVSAAALISFIIVKLYFNPFPIKTDSIKYEKTNGAVLLEFAVFQNKKAEQKRFIEAQSKQLLKSIL